MLSWLNESVDNVSGGCFSAYLQDNVYMNKILGFCFQWL